MQNKNSFYNNNLTPLGTPDVGKYGIPTAANFIPNKGQDEAPKNVREIYTNLVKQGLHPKDAAKQAQDMTGHSVVTGRPIERRLKFSKRSGRVIGQYGTSSGKAASGKFGMYGR